ncbi:MAG: aminotransferase class I/II-fold pyridoxal phosphate-dependent enzyme, partial [Desulfobacterales bacterium]
LIAEHDNLLVSRTLSKSYSLAGLRMGYVLGPEPLIAALHSIKDSYNTDVVSQRLDLAAVRDQDWMRSNAALVKGTRSATAREWIKRSSRSLVPGG